MTPECVSGDVLISTPLNSFLSFNACLTHSSESFSRPTESQPGCSDVRASGFFPKTSAGPASRPPLVFPGQTPFCLPVGDRSSLWLPHCWSCRKSNHRLSPGSEDDDTAFTHFSDLPVQSSSPVPDLRDPRWARILSPRGGHGPTPLDSVPWALDTGTSELLASLGRHGCGAEWPWTCPQSGAA